MSGFVLHLGNFAIEVFTSSVNVCFNGNEIRNGNEVDNKWLECICFKQGKDKVCIQHHLDAYSRSKQEAEKIILSTSSPNVIQKQSPPYQAFQNESGKQDLRTCILR